jgi:hypothetical protein
MRQAIAPHVAKTGTRRTCILMRLRGEAISHGSGKGGRQAETDNAGKHRTQTNSSLCDVSIQGLRG